ncbi:unnamed protein product [Onchocerca flexuosa]|uniref:Ovule protein n=1 Tax=Onchocerca flexuosa TaxID=387005 RepID=A0A183HH38_9BILA|nr:unnamed protein product [Onchocerca flexuosa]
MSAMEVTETPTAESEQMKEQIEEVQQQKVEETKKEETPTQEEATKAVENTVSHPSAISENTESSAESEKKDAPQVYDLDLFFISFHFIFFYRHNQKEQSPFFLLFFIVLQKL